MPRIATTGSRSLLIVSNQYNACRFQERTLSALKLGHTEGPGQCLWVRCGCGFTAIAATNILPGLTSLGPAWLRSALGAGGRRGFVDVNPEEAALDLFLFGLHLIDKLLRQAAGDVRVDRGQRRSTFRHHAEVLQILSSVRAAGHLVDDV